MAFVEAKGKTVDEAIFKGLEEMGLSLDEVDIDIVHEGGKGLLALAKARLCICLLYTSRFCGKACPDTY